MQKNYLLLNSSFDIEGSKILFDYLDKNLVLFPTYTKKIRNYKIKYQIDPKLYNEILIDLKKFKPEIVRIYGDRYKRIVDNKDISFLIDDDSVIVRTIDSFMVIGTTELSMNHVLDLIGEAIYEGYYLNNDLIINGSAFAINHENGSVIIGPTDTYRNKLFKECIMGIPSAYIGSDYVGVHHNRAIGSISPIKEESEISLPDYLKKYNLSMDSNVDIHNIILPHFSANSSFEITKADKKEAKGIINDHILNYEDSTRPYLWVNEIKTRECNNKTIDTKLNNIISNANIYYVECGPKIAKEDIKVMKKTMKI